MDSEFKELRDVFGDIAGQLRIGQGVDEERFKTLCALLVHYGDQWRHSPGIPKAAAAVLVEIVPAFYECESLYEGDVLSRVGEAGMKVNDILFEILNDERAGATEGNPSRAPIAPFQIDRFVGDYHFLSNFFASPIELDGIVFPTVEHAFQASKTSDRNERLRIAAISAPGSAKRAGRKVTLRADWEDVKLRIMEELVRKKFSDPVLASKLMATGSAELREGNSWNDRFWGVCRGSGRNELGKILTRVRANLLIEKQTNRSCS